MNITMNHNDCWMQDGATARCRTARRTARPQRGLRARLVAYALVALGLALAGYGERYVLAVAPAPVEASLATCAANLVTGGDAFTATCALPAPIQGATL